MAARAAATATRATEQPPATAELHPDALFQVLDNTGTWHAATVGAGVLCTTNRDAARTSNTTEGYDSTTTVQWDYGVDQVNCRKPGCSHVTGRVS